MKPSALLRERCERTSKEATNQPTKKERKKEKIKKETSQPGVYI
jgi:hypothetical protein